MDWNRIKTIFIVSFLILDVYLMYQYFENRNANQYEIMTQTTFEDRLTADEIEYVSVPKDQIYASYLSAKPKVFGKEEKLELDESEITTYSGTTLTVHLKEPIKVSKDSLPSDIGSFLKGKIIHGDQYAFWEKNEENNTVVYYQKYKDHFFYKNKNGQLVLQLNDNDEIISYEQTMLEDIEEISGEEEVLPPLKAIETLYDERVLRPHSKITKIELGYYSLIQPASQVLTPTWHFVINGEENVFVNAFEGHILQLDSDTETKMME